MSVPRAPIELFYSYADADESLRIELDKHLSRLRHEGVITTFHKHQVKAGTDRTKTLNHHLDTASIILLLVSADFLASDYCYGTEMQRAMERHNTGEAYVIPILLRPVDWKSAPFEKLEVLPSNGQPITEWHSSDAAFTDICRSIGSALQHLAPPLERTKPFFKIPLFRLSLVFLAAFGLIVLLYFTIIAQGESPLTPTSSGPTSVVELFVVLGLILLITVTIDPIRSFFKRHRYVKKLKKRGT